jgi:hypothetical protein
LVGRDPELEVGLRAGDGGAEIGVGRADLNDGGVVAVFYLLGQTDRAQFIVVENDAPPFDLGPQGRHLPSPLAAPSNLFGAEGVEIAHQNYKTLL